MAFRLENTSRGEPSRAVTVTSESGVVATLRGAPSSADGRGHGSRGPTGTTDNERSSELAVTMNSPVSGSGGRVDRPAARRQA